MLTAEQLEKEERRCACRSDTDATSILILIHEVRRLQSVEAAARELLLVSSMDDITIFDSWESDRFYAARDRLAAALEGKQ